MTVFDLAAAGAVGLREWACLEPFAPHCTCEIESARDSDVAPGYDTLNRAWLASSLLVLCGYTRHLCLACSAYSWGLVAGHQHRTAETFTVQLVEEGVQNAVFKSRRELPPFKGNLLDLHLKMVVDPRAREEPIDTDIAAWVGARFDRFNDLAAQSASFRLALEAVVDFRFATDARGAIARLWAGIEAVYGISTELVFRISLLSACLLAPRGHERREKFRQVKELYSLRSKAVHGDSLPDAKIDEALSGSWQLLRDLLLLMIDKGHVLRNDDLDSAMFD